MKIQTVETFLVPPRWLFLKITTDQGVVGWGEPVVEGRAATVQTMINELTPILIGRDVAHIEDTWQMLWRGGFYRGGAILASAVAGIDQALWDIAGKALGVPIYELLGGPVRNRVRTYAWVESENLESMADSIQARLDQGFDAVKLVASGKLSLIAGQESVNDVVARAERARTELGPSRDFALDFHGRSTPMTSRRLLSLLEHTQPLFVEEPTVPELAGTHLRELVSSTNIPLAAGERFYSRWEFKPLLEAGLAVAQPDVSHAGGISETRRIAALAETYGALVAPHCPLGPIALAASLHVDIASPNFLIQEQSGGMEYNGGWNSMDYLVDTSVFDTKNGYIDLPTAPGLGIAIDEDAVRKASKNGHTWRAPLWRHDDGSFAEW